MAPAQPSPADILKHRFFVTESMRDKPVTDLVGIDLVYGARLNRLGFDEASVVLGQFLVLDSHKGNFVKWLKETTKCTTYEATLCYQCLKEWCETHM